MMHNNNYQPTNQQANHFLMFRQILSQAKNPDNDMITKLTELSKLCHSDYSRQVSEVLIASIVNVSNLHLY
jgi:hypothetical protein